MTQEQLKEQFIDYAENNLNNETILQAIIYLLGNIGDQLYNELYTKEANRLWTCQDIIKKDVLNLEEQ